MTPLLETRALSKHFGGLHVTNDVNFALAAGEIHCLIGPNGAGKSTFFRLLLGEYTPERGRSSTPARTSPRSSPSRGSAGA